LELPYDPIQKDITQEAYPHFMLYQLCTLTLQRIYARMMSMGGNDDNNEQQALH